MNAFMHRNFYIMLKSKKDLKKDILKTKRVGGISNTLNLYYGIFIDS